MALSPRKFRSGRSDRLKLKMCSAPEDQIDAVVMNRIEQQANISLRLHTIAGLVDRSPALFRQ